MSKYSDELERKYPTIGDLKKRTKEYCEVELPKLKDIKRKKR